MAYYVGQKIRLSGFFATQTGTGVDPTTILGKVKVPAGTITTYTYGTDVELVRDGTGSYYVDWTTTAAGTHTFRFSGTGAAVAAGESTFVVETTAF